MEAAYDRDSEMVAKRELDVISRSKQLDECLGMLADSVDRLAGRLTPVLSPSSPLERVAEEQDRRGEAPLAETLNAYSSRTLALRHRIDELLERLEI